MYQAPPPLKRTAKPLPLYATSLGGLYGFLAQTLYGLLLYGLFVLLNQASLSILPLIIFSLIFGVSGGLAQAITSGITGFLLARRSLTFTQHQARKQALVVSSISALLINPAVIIYYKVPLRTFDELFTYGVFLLLPTCIYIALSTHVSAKLNQLWHYNHSEKT